MSRAGQSRRSLALGANDPRNYRAPQGEMFPDVWVGAGLSLDNQGRLSLDPTPAYLSDVAAPLWKRTATATSYTAKPSDFLIAVTSTAAARTITLPPLTSVPHGKAYIVKDESGAAGTNNITIDGNLAETIDGAATKVMATNYESLTLYSNGVAWFTL